MTCPELGTSSTQVNHNPRRDGRPRPSGRAKLAFLADRISTTVALIASTLREIFDESAYTRFLARHELRVSRQSYAAFLHEQEFVKARRHRCC